MKSLLPLAALFVVAYSATRGWWVLPGCLCAGVLLAFRDSYIRRDDLAQRIR